MLMPLLHYGYPSYLVFAADQQPENYMDYDNNDLFNCSDITQELLLEHGITDIACQDTANQVVYCDAVVLRGITSGTLAYATSATQRQRECN